MKPFFDVTIRTSERRLGTLLGVIAEDREFELRGVVPVYDHHPTPLEPESRFRNGKRNKGISGIDLVIQTLKNSKALTLGELEQVFEGRGFAASSTAPTLRRLSEEGRVVRNNFGHWSFVK